MTITLLIIVLTCITSIAAFNNPVTKQQLIFSPYLINRNKEWFRFISSAFIHGDWIHLIFNMVALWGFGKITETFFKIYFGNASITLFILMYLLAIILAHTFNYFRHKENAYFQSLGASSGVAAVLFAGILFEPFLKVGLFFLPIRIPGFIFAVLYLLYSMHMARQNSDYDDHYSHFFGSVFGFIFPIVLKPELFLIFIQKFTHGY